MAARKPPRNRKAEAGFVFQIEDRRAAAEPDTNWTLTYDTEGNLRLSTPGAKRCIHGKAMSALKTMGHAICHLCRYEAEVLARRQTEQKEIT